jgi:hypothetical protein
MNYCKICGLPGCKKHSSSFEGIKKVEGFSGSSPPEIFVGKWNYPNVYIGILSPQEYGDTSLLSSQELWHEKKLPMTSIKELRNKLIYGRTKTNIKKALEQNRFLSTMQEVAMTSKSIATEFKLSKSIEKNLEKDNHTPIINRAAFVKSVRLEENPIIERKVDNLANDTDVKSTTALLELEKSKTPTSTMIKVLSAGLLGLGSQRKLVPTRWAITAVDDTLSKEKLEKIRDYPEISDILIFTAEYLGNHYEFLLLPDNFSFEVIEINSAMPETSWHDYESFFGRKNYASSVTGAYYSNRLALTEYLEKARKQASCVVFREVGKEYTQSMGVGVLRQISRDAFSKIPEKFSTIQEALDKIQSRIQLPIQTFTNQSKILAEYGKQIKLSKWI